MLKRLISLMLSVSLIVVMLCTAVPVSAAQYYVNTTIDYSQVTDTSSYTHVIGGWTKTANSSATVANNMLEWTTSDYGMKNTYAVMAIPLTEAIETKNGPFTIAITAKLSNISGRRYKGFGILGSDTGGDYDAGADNLIGLAQLDDTNYMVNAGNLSHGLWMYKQDDGETNFNTNSEYNNVGTKNKNDIKFITTSVAAESFYTYRWDVDPETQTFRFYYRKDGDTTWIQPYADFYMMNTNTETQNDRFDTPGVLPTCALPEKIQSIKFRQYHYLDTGKETSATTYIKSIVVQQEKPVYDCNYDMSKTGIEGVTAAADGSGTSTVRQDESGETVWTVSGNEKNKAYKLNVDIDDFTITNKNITLEFTAKLPEKGFKCVGFPVLMDENDGTYYFGFDTPTPNNNSFRLEQTLFRQLGAAKMTKFDGYTTYVVAMGGLDKTANLKSAIWTDKTSLSPSKNAQQVSFGTSNASPVGASAEYYDFKFVIDPVAKEYRYYHKADSSDTWLEIFDGCPGYPIQIDSLPKKLSAVEFRIANGLVDNDSTEANVYIKDVKVYTDETQTNTSGAIGRIVNRTYSYTGDTMPSAKDSSTTANVTVKVVNYGESSISGKVFMAVYDADGILTYVSFAEEGTALNSGMNMLNFTNIPAAQAEWGDQTTVEKTGVLKDPYTYKLFIWNGENGLVPLTDSEKL